jgi:hypothetical protein
MGDASSTHDTREKPAATRGTKRKAKRDYVLLLMVEAVGDADHESFLTLLKNSCDATVHEHCFMKNGTRHVTLAQLTEDEAERIRFSSAPMLPLELVLAKPQPWGAGLYLSLSEAAQQTIADLVLKLDPAPLKTTDSYRKQPHLSLYRGFNRGEALKQQLKKRKLSGQRWWWHPSLQWRCLGARGPALHSLCHPGRGPELCAGEPEPGVPGPGL